MAMAAEVPVFDVLLDVVVNRVAMFERAADERFGEEARLGLVGGGRRQLDGLSPMSRAFVIGDGGGALGVPEFIERPLQILRRTQIMLKQKLDGAFARFAAFAHNSTQAWLTRREGEMKMLRATALKLGAARVYCVTGFGSGLMPLRQYALWPLR